MRTVRSDCDDKDDDKADGNDEECEKRWKEERDGELMAKMAFEAGCQKGTAIYPG